TTITSQGSFPFYARLRSSSSRPEFDLLNIIPSTALMINRLNPRDTKTAASAAASVPTLFLSGKLSFVLAAIDEQTMSEILSQTARTGGVPDRFWAIPFRAMCGLPKNVCTEGGGEQRDDQ
ncbi:hypothetical protein PENTCL1PPCAC_24040, partial [Pristionchus entomophagus]